MRTATAILLPVLLALLACVAIAAEEVNSPYFDANKPYNAAFECNPGSCKDGALCYPSTTTWTDSTKGCKQFECAKSTKNGKTQWSVATRGCPLLQAKAGYKKVDGDSSKAYPACCPKLVKQ